MDSSQVEIERLAKQYGDRKEIVVNYQQPFGLGTDGSVWPTSNNSALKILYRQSNYENEKECYLRLREQGIRRIMGFAVPQLIDFDDEYRAIEMGVVRPPYILDFGKVYLDQQPPYWSDAQSLEVFHLEGEENFGEHWRKVRAILLFLEKRLGIYYVDPKPANIHFGD